WQTYVISSRDEAARVAQRVRVCGSLFYAPIDPHHPDLPLSLHDALPICRTVPGARSPRTASRSRRSPPRRPGTPAPGRAWAAARSEEHTSELQSRENLVCRLLLEKKTLEETLGALDTLVRQAKPVYVGAS